MHARARACRLGFRATTTVCTCFLYAVANSMFIGDVHPAAAFVQAGLRVKLSDAGREYIKIWDREKVGASHRPWKIVLTCKGPEHVKMLVLRLNRSRPTCVFPTEDAEA